MSTINITDLSTYKNSTWQKDVIFHPYFNDLVLAVDFDLSNDIASTPDVRITISFEIIEFRTNKVVFYHTHDWNIPLTWQSVYSILGPLIPNDIGLRWRDSDVFGLRASIEAAHGIGTTAFGNFNCLAVSGISWFRLEHVIRIDEGPELIDE
jgi:hypothetical protein